MKVPNIVNNDFKPGFRINLHHKDLNNALKKGKDVDAKLTLSETIMTMFEELLHQANGEVDHSALYSLYK